MRSKVTTFAFFLIVAAGCAFLIRRDLAAAVAGAAAGWFGHIIWSWGWLEFLDEPSPWRALRAELTNFRNVFFRNRADNWERLYQAGGYHQLVAGAPAPRHHLVAATIRTRFPSGARVLDVGCGTAVQYPLIAAPGVSYLGIDVIEAMIKECRERFASDPSCRFEVADFDRFRTEERFDVIILAEFLYYFPLPAVQPLFRHAQSLLRDAESIVIVTMGAKSNRRLRQIWKLLGSLAAAAESVSLLDPESGSIRTIRVYPR